MNKEIEKSNKIKTRIKIKRTDYEIVESRWQS